jgi:hypothetical protein
MRIAVASARRDRDGNAENRCAAGDGVTYGNGAESVALIDR